MLDNHYMWWYRWGKHYGENKKIIVPKLNTCQYPDCKEQATKERYCKKHFDLVNKRYERKQERAIIKPPTTRKKYIISK